MMRKMGKYHVSRPLWRFRAGILAVLAGAVLFLNGCSRLTDTETEQLSQTSAVVDYRCISNSGSDKKIYVILKNYHGDYWTKMIGGMIKAAKELDASVYLGGIDNETDVSGQISLMNQAVEEGADGILLAPANSNALTDQCKAVREKQIPLVLVDSSINSREFDACYMTDNMEAGEIAAEQMLSLLKKAGNTSSDALKVGILLSSDTSQAMVNRVSGFLDYWANHAPATWEIEQNIYLNGGDVNKAQTDAAALLKGNDAVKGILGCNNTSSIGIVKTLVRGNRTDVVMVGFDLAEETKQLIKDPRYQAVSLMQKQDQMGYLGLHCLYELIEGKTLEQKYFDTGIIVADSDYLRENGDT